MTDRSIDDIRARFTFRRDALGTWASFVPLIGGWTDERVSIAVGIEPDGEPLVATARPLDASPDHAPTGPGVFALRWLECAPRDADELVELSEAAWPAFEASVEGTRVFGLFRVGMTDDGTVARFLLCTGYASVSGWDATRADTDSAEFRRRRELTTRSQVSLWRLAPSRA